MCLGARFFCVFAFLVIGGFSHEEFSPLDLFGSSILAGLSF